MKKQRTFPLYLSLTLLGLDQISKYFFYNQEIWSQFPLLHPLLNTGISRSMAMPMGIILTISLLCSIFFSYLFQKKHLTAGEYSLFIAWTLGNFIDRIRLGGVRDFISIWTFPVFNLADTFLTVAVILRLIRQIFPCKKKEKI